jgi:hypothetical protein
MPMATCVRAGFIGLAMVAVLAAAACNQQGPAPPTKITMTTPSTSTRASPSSTTRADPHLSSVEATVARFWGLVDALGADPKRSLDELTTVARGQTLETWRELLTQRRRQAHKQIGTTAIVSSQESSSGGKVTVDMCIDVSKTDLVDKDGKSVVAAHRAPRVHYTSVVEQGTDGRYYVMQDKAVETC